MRLAGHMARSRELFGVSGEPIHRWVDGCFDQNRFRFFLRSRGRVSFDPYAHRKQRHCQEALPEVRLLFGEEFPGGLAESIFLQHLRDDYQGYEPVRSDFDDPGFLDRYHRPERKGQN